MYDHFKTATSWYRRNEFCDVMTLCHDVMTSSKSKNNSMFELSKQTTYRNKNNHLSIYSTSWDYNSMFLTSWHGRHDVTSSCKYKTDNIFVLSNPKYHINKKIIFLSHLQAEIAKIRLVMSWRDVMTSRCHAAWLNQNLSTVFCEWGLELWKNGIFSWSKNFLI